MITAHSQRDGDWDTPGMWDRSDYERVWIKHSVTANKPITVMTVIESPGELRLTGDALPTLPPLVIAGDQLAAVITCESVTGDIVLNKRPLCPNCRKVLIERRRRSKLVQQCTCGYRNVFRVKPPVL